MYVPKPFPQFDESLIPYIAEELKAISDEFGLQLQKRLQFVTAQPDKPRDGDIIAADGVNWNPGAGKGVYQYVDGLWIPFHESYTPCKNLILGGEFGGAPWQLGTSFTTPSTALADNWRIGTPAAAGVVTVTKNTDAPTPSESGVNSTGSMRVTVTTADAALAAADNYQLYYTFEGHTIAPAGFGKVGTRFVSLSFWVYSTKTGISTVGLRNTGGGRSYLKEFTINASNTWEKKTLIFPVDTTGTWLYDTGVGLYLTFALGQGSNFVGAADTWAAANYIATANQVNHMDTIGNIFALDLVKLELGNVPTPYDGLTGGLLLAALERYYEKSFDAGVTPAQNAGTSGAQRWTQTVGAATAQYGVWIPFKTRKRTAPVITLYNPSAANAQARNGNTGTDCTLTAATGFECGMNASFTSPAGSAAGNALLLHWTADSRM